MIKKRLINLGISAALLLGASRVNSGILYFSKQEAPNSSPITVTKEGVNMDSVVSRIKSKYPKKNLEYFSRGILQFENSDFVKDSEIGKMLQQLSLSEGKTILDGVNFYRNHCRAIDNTLRHIGDEKKSWFPIKEPQGTSYEKEFTIDSLSGMKNPKLGIEVFSSDSGNNVYINGISIGILPKISKSKWGDLMKKYREGSPFLYGELDVSGYLKEGENTLRIESGKSGWLSKGYDDFMIRRIQIVYDSSNESNADKK